MDMVGVADHDPLASLTNLGLKSSILDFDLEAAPSLNCTKSLIH